MTWLFSDTNPKCLAFSFSSHTTSMSIPKMSSEIVAIRKRLVTQQQPHGLINFTQGTLLASRRSAQQLEPLAHRFAVRLIRLEGELYMRVQWLILFKINLLPPARFFSIYSEFFLTFSSVPGRAFFRFSKLHKLSMGLSCTLLMMMIMMAYDKH